MSDNNFAGCWDLVPELCLYQQGDVPLCGFYRIDCDGDEVTIIVQWTDAAGNAQSASYGGPNDGSKQVIEAPGITHVNFTRVDENTLDSGGFNKELEVMYARRVVSQAGDLLCTVQTNWTEQGEFTNFQVYRRHRS